MGCSIVEIAPVVVDAVPLKIRKQRTVAQALQNQSWPTDIQGGLSPIGLFEYLQLWDMLLDTTLSQDEDVHIWRLDSSGIFSSKSAYRAFFNGAILLNIGGGCGNHGLLRNAKFFSGSPSGIGAGLRIVWRGVACHTRPCVRSVTRKKKISNTCLLRVSFPGSSGLEFKRLWDFKAGSQAAMRFLLLTGGEKQLKRSRKKLGKA